MNLHLSHQLGVVKKVEKELLGLTDIKKPRIRELKRASTFRELFNLSKEDNVWKDVNTYRSTFTSKAGKKIQSLVTLLNLQRKRARIAEKKRHVGGTRSHR